MNTRMLFFAILALLLLPAGVQAGRAAGDQGSFRLESESFAPGKRLPVRLVRRAAGGENLSPALTWRNPPAGTRSYTLTDL